MTDSLKKRAFIVGCARSGTTLLESLLGGHHDIKGFPESAFYINLVGQVDIRTRATTDIELLRKIRCNFSDVRIKLGIPNKALVKASIRQFLDKIGHIELLSQFPENSNSIAVQSDAFVKILDSLTLAEGKKFWIEKTPEHLLYIEEIERHVKPVKFIHIVRSGPDVVASLFDASKKHGGNEWAEFESLDRCINKWNHAISLSIRNLNRPNHIAISYEQLVEDTNHVLHKLCDFLETDFDEDMLTNYSSVATFVSAGEPWKAKTGGAIQNANSTKFKTDLTPDQQKYVLERLHKVDHSQFYLR